MANGDSFGAAVPLRKDAFGPPVLIKTDRPGLVTGLRESAGIPTWAEATAWAHRVWSDPVAAAKRGGHEAVQLAGFIVNHPGQFAWQMTNIPQMQRAWKQGNYREMVGLLVGTGAQLLPFVGEESVAAKSLRGLRAGLTGESAEAFKASEAARVAEKAAKVERAAASPKLRVTIGERLKSPRMESVERALRAVPIAGERYQGIASERKRAILALRSAVTAEAQADRTAAQTLYRTMETQVPEIQVFQRNISDLRTAERKALLSDNFKAARDVAIQLDDAKKIAREVIEKRGTPEALKVWDRADELWSRYRARESLSDVIEGQLLGIKPGEQVLAAARPQEFRRTLVERLKDLQTDPSGDVIRRALGPAREGQLMSTADLLDRIQRDGQGWYMLTRLGGWALLGGGAAAGGYLGEIAYGIAGLSVLSSLLTTRLFTRQRVLTDFLKAVDAGDVAKTNALADRLTAAATSLAKSQQVKAEESRARAVSAAPSALSERERLGLQVPVQLQPRPLEDPIGDMLRSVLGEPSSAEIPGGREQEEVLRTKLARELERQRTRARLQESSKVYRGQR